MRSAAPPPALLRCPAGLFSSSRASFKHGEEAVRSLSRQTGGGARPADNGDDGAVNQLAKLVGKPVGVECAGPRPRLSMRPSTAFLWAMVMARPVLYLIVRADGVDEWTAIETTLGDPLPQQWSRKAFCVAYAVSNKANFINIS